MITFGNTKLYAQGTCVAVARDIATGNVVYSDNKFQTGNVTTSMDMGEIRAGLGNAIAAIIPSNSALNVEFNAADFSLWAKAAQVGARLSYNAIVPVCQVVEAESANLTISVADGTPVAQYGYNDITCFVQRVGDTSLIATDGVAYNLDPETGAISDFTAVTGQRYKVWYFVNSASAQVAELSTMFDPSVVHFTAQIAVYSNKPGSGQSAGTKVGWLYIVVPRLKFGGNAGIVGDQTTADTTSLSGQAIAYDDDAVSGVCTDCDASSLAYYIFSPINASENIVGLVAKIGGVITVPANGSVQVDTKFVMDDGSLIEPTSYSDGFTYALDPAISGVSVSPAGLIAAGATTGDSELTVTYTDGSKTLTDVVNVSVVSA